MDDISILYKKLWEARSKEVIKMGQCECCEVEIRSSMEYIQDEHGNYICVDCTVELTNKD